MALPPFLAFLENCDPEFAKSIEGVVSAAMAPGALDQKTKLLLALALDAAHGSTQGVASVANQLRSLGTTNEEIAEALRMAYFASGNSILIAMSAAFSK